jgi:bifunctional DNA-binding transcriptional regulator/antitoxin component of YhaV-PrlF toxin-antitoxin module
LRLALEPPPLHEKVPILVTGKGRATVPCELRRRAGLRDDNDILVLGDRPGGDLTLTLFSVVALRALAQQAWEYRNWPH